MSNRDDDYADDTPLPYEPYRDYHGAWGDREREKRATVYTMADVVEAIYGVSRWIGICFFALAIIVGVVGLMAVTRLDQISEKLEKRR